jgi:hypothetical protein
MEENFCLTRDLVLEVSNEGRGLTHKMTTKEVENLSCKYMSYLLPLHKNVIKFNHSLKASNLKSGEVVYICELFSKDGVIYARDIRNNVYTYRKLSIRSMVLNLEYAWMFDYFKCGSHTVGKQY